MNIKIIKKEGYNYTFNPKACENCSGNCCIGESGYIWVTFDEIKSISNLLNLDIDKFKSTCLIKIGYRYTIKEVIYGNGFSCIFFDMEKKQCQIYKQRPSQCRTFPFWEYFKTHKEELVKECPGILF